MSAYLPPNKDNKGSKRDIYNTKEGLKVMTTVDDSNPDHVYYNILINNTSSSLIKANFNQPRNFPILQNPSDYYMSVIRFTCPFLTVPLFVFTDNKYSVTLQYNNTIVQTYLVYQACTTDATNRDVKKYQQLLDMINVAFQTSFTGLGVLPTATVAPYMIYDASTQLFSLIAQKALVTDGVSVYFNAALSLFFPQFNYISTIPVGSASSGKDEKFVIEDTKNNTYNTTYYQMQTQGPDFANFPDWNSITFTGNVGVPPEYYSNLTDNSANPFKLVLTDFEPTFDTAQDATSTFLYTPTSEFRLISLTQKDPLYAFNFNITYTNKLTREENQLYIYPGTVATVKILFRSKKLGI
jgi:hypothetical protein